MSNHVVISRRVAFLTAVTMAAGAAHGQATAGAGAERFVAPVVAAGGTLTVQPRAAVAGVDVRLRDVCRWSDADAGTFGPVADLTVCRLGDGGSTATVGVAELRAALRDAGVNGAGFRLAGAAACVVTRDITVVPAGVAPVASAAVLPTTGPTTGPAAELAAAGDRPMSAAEAECNPFHTLRERLTADVAARLNLPVSDLQLTFAGSDATLLNLAEPAFHFQLDAKHLTNLGDVSWNVTVMSGGATQRATVTAKARAWQTQVVMAATTAAHAVLRADDVSERRVLVDRLSDDAPLTAAQAVGQQAGRDLRPGSVLTGRMIEPLPLARAGQYVTVTLQSGGVQLRTVAKAMEGGTFGQTIKVRNEATKDEFTVTLTGPQVAVVGPVPGDAGLASVRE